jgi:hypothetical protein
VRQIIALVGERARDAAHDAIGSAAAPGPFAAVVDDLVARRIDPWSAAEALTGQGQ